MVVNLKYIILLLFLYWISFYPHCEASTLKDETFLFCAKIDEKTFNNMFSGLIYNDAYILLTQNISDVDISPDSERGTSSGRLYVKSHSFYTFDSLFVMTLKDSNVTDVVIFISKKNRLFNGFFYSEKYNIFDDLRYIGSDGSVRHIKIFIHQDSNCLSNFPIDILKRIDM
ncbi:hypothetical protein E2A72_22060 [Salmonella enterica]|nr:hypothetical protein [Salmonella enterica]EDQ4901538.1 hypothetical protein [Salmonella enterica]EIO1811386.1 hypothetical protein [Salmonella enterica]